jgi:peptide/nickel transport system substrate-binding protein
VIPDANTRVQALESGEVDIVPNIPPDQVGSAPKVVAAPKPSGSAYFRLNEVSGPFQDVKLRQAVNYAIDREALVKALFNDGEYAVPAACQGAPIHSEGANKSLKPYPYDVEKAKQLVEEAGATGTPIDIAAVSGTYAQDRNAAQVVAQSLEAIGLKPNLKIENYNAWFKKIYAVQADAPDMTFAETTNNLGHVARQTGLLYNSKGSVSAYNDPEMDALLKTASTELDDAKRQEAYDAVMKKGCDDAIAMFLYDRRDIYGMTERIVFEPGIELPPRLNYDEIQVINP